MSVFERKAQDTAAENMEIIIILYFQESRVLVRVRTTGTKHYPSTSLSDWETVGVSLNLDVLCLSG